MKKSIIFQKQFYYLNIIISNELVSKKHIPNDLLFYNSIGICCFATNSIGICCFATNSFNYNIL